MILGTISTSWQSIRASHERDRAIGAEKLAQTRFESEQKERRRAEKAEKQALDEASRANVVRDVIVKMLSFANPYDEEGKPSDYTVRQLLWDFSEELPEELERQPVVKAEIHAILAKGFVNLGRDHAPPHLQAALKIRQSIYGEHHPKVAESLISYASYLWLWTKDRARAEQFSRQAISILRDYPEEVNLRLRASRHLVTSLLLQNKYSEAEGVMQEASALSKQHKLENNTWLAQILNGTGRSKMLQGDFDKAESLCERSLKIHKKVAPQHIETAYCLLNLGEIKNRLKKYAEAEDHCREAIIIFDRHNSRNGVARVLALLRSAMDQQDKTTRFEKIVIEYFERGGIRYLCQFALTKLQNGDLKGYQEICQKAAAKCANSANLYSLDQITYTCSFHPEALTDWSSEVLLARRILTVSPEDSWYQSSLGAILYRASEFTESVDVLSHVEQQDKDSDENELFQKFSVIRRRFFLTMAYQKMGNEKQAYEWSTKAATSMKSLFKEQDQNEGPFLMPFRRFHLELLRAEVERTLGIKDGKQKAEDNEQQSVVKEKTDDSAVRIGLD